MFCTQPLHDLPLWWKVPMYTDWTHVNPMPQGNGKGSDWPAKKYFVCFFSLVPPRELSSNYFPNIIPEELLVEGYIWWKEVGNMFLACKPISSCVIQLSSGQLRFTFIHLFNQDSKNLVWNCSFIVGWLVNFLGC